MKKNYSWVTLLLLLAMGNACNNSNDQSSSSQPKQEATAVAATQAALREHVMTSAEQKALTPDAVIENLKAGNKHYMANKLTSNDYMGMMKSASHGQYPEAFILSCMDSRVPVEEVFDMGIGDVFVGRVAGNIIDEDVLGSMEYGCKVAGSKLIVVLGHQSCGAVKAAIEHEKLGNITAMLEKMKPALDKSKDFAGEQHVENDNYVERVVKENVQNSIRNIQLKSPVLKEMVDKGEIKIVGAYYSFETGEVIFLN